MTDLPTAPGSVTTAEDLGHHFRVLALRLHGGEAQQPSLDRVLQVARDAVGAEEAGVSLLLGGRRPRTVAATADRVRSTDQRQYDLGGGPVLDALRGRETVHSHDLSRDVRWPELGPEGDIRSVLSIPMVLAGPGPAALTMYSVRPEAFGGDRAEVAALFAPFAALALHDLMESRRGEHLEQALATSRTIGTAIGILMARELLTEEQAFQRLVTASQHLNVKLRDIADRVKTTGDVPRP